MAEIQPGDLVHGDGHLWRVLRVEPDTVVLRGRGATAEFPLVDGLIVSDREFAHAALPGAAASTASLMAADVRSATRTARRGAGASAQDTRERAEAERLERERGAVAG